MLAILLATAALGVVTAFPSPGASGNARAAAQARGVYHLDFIRVLQRIADLRADPPDEPLVCLLGGSSARECTVSNASWSDGVSTLRGYPSMAVNLGSKHRKFAEDRRLVNFLPDGTSIVFIGVNMGRFCNGRGDPPIVLPEPSGTARSSSSATRGSTRIMPNWRKRQIANQWMVKRWPYFRARFRFNVRLLERVCTRSLARGQYPVIVDLPRNMDIIGHRLDRPLNMYHRECRALAKRLGIPYLQFQGRTGLR
ncbi:MAG: hypothetical protein IH629_05095, partial [Thermoleophilia bacterium]|nr:hypothetical protein [Thermoleophilia bacterium]